MKCYLAGSWSHRADMPEIAKRFEDSGNEITWKWWDTPDIPEDGNRNAELRTQALNNKKGVEAADLIILINSEKSEGKAVEQGLAIAMNKPIIAVGKLGDGTSKNVFHFLPCYKWVDTVEDAVEAVNTIQWLVSNAS